jgi:hypothetical protein
VGRQANALPEASVALLLVVADRLAKVGVIGFEPVEQIDFISEVVLIRGLGHCQVGIGVRLAQLLHFRQFLQSLHRELADRLQHDEARLPAGTILLPE